jgi:hypothetical protein
MVETISTKNLFPCELSMSMSYETNKKKNGMGTNIFIAIYIPNSFIVNILSPREGKRLSNYLLHP